MPPSSPASTALPSRNERPGGTSSRPSHTSVPGRRRRSSQRTQRWSEFAKGDRFTLSVSLSLCLLVSLFLPFANSHHLCVLCDERRPDTAAIGQGRSPANLDSSRHRERHSEHNRGH